MLFVLFVVVLCRCCMRYCFSDLMVCGFSFWCSVDMFFVLVFLLMMYCCMNWFGFMLFIIVCSVGLVLMWFMNCWLVEWVRLKVLMFFFFIVIGDGGIVLGIVGRFLGLICGVCCSGVLFSVWWISLSVYFVFLLLVLCCSFLRCVLICLVIFIVSGILLCVMWFMVFVIFCGSVLFIIVLLSNWLVCCV